MIVYDIINDSAIKPKDKVKKLIEGLMTYDFGPPDLINDAEQCDEDGMAIALEAIEYVTRYSPEWADPHYLALSVMSIGSKNINLSRMAAQVVTNLAKVYPNDLDNAIEPLRENSVSDNHVIRMSAASALEQMYALPKYHNMEFWQMLSTLYSVEKKDNIRKIYQRALDS